MSYSFLDLAYDVLKQSPQPMVSTCRGAPSLAAIGMSDMRGWFKDVSPKASHAKI